MSTTESNDDVSRRDFITGVGLTGAGVATGLSYFFSKDNIPRPTADPVKIGIIGVGARGTALLRALLKCPGSEVRAICDKRKAKRDAATQLVKREHGELKSNFLATADYRKLLKDGDVEAVIIATPHYLHGPMAMDALEAGNDGKHVYCEKAMAFTIGECKDLYRAVTSRTGDRFRVFQVGHQRHYSKLYRKVHELVQGGRIGNVTAARAQWNRNDEIRRPCADPAHDRLVNWRLYSEYSGGLMSEFASHQIDVVNMLLETHPYAICGFGGHDYPRYNDDRDTSDNVHVVFDYRVDWKEDVQDDNGDWRFVKSGRKYPVRFDYMSIMTNQLLGPTEMIFGDEGTIEVTLAGGRFWKEAKMLRNQRKKDQGTDSTQTLQKEILLTGSTVAAVKAGVRPADADLEEEKDKTDWTQFVGRVPGAYDKQETLLALDSFLNCIRHSTDKQYIDKNLRANVKYGVWGAAPTIMANIAMREKRTVYWEEFFDGSEA